MDTGMDKRGDRNAAPPSARARVTRSPTGGLAVIGLAIGTFTCNNAGTLTGRHAKLFTR